MMRLLFLFQYQCIQLPYYTPEVSRTHKDSPQQNLFKCLLPEILAATPFPNTNFKLDEDNFKKLQIYTSILTTTLLGTVSINILIFQLKIKDSLRKHIHNQS